MPTTPKRPKKKKEISRRKRLRKKSPVLSKEALDVVRKYSPWDAHKLSENPVFNSPLMLVEETHLIKAVETLFRLRMNPERKVREEDARIIESVERVIAAEWDRRRPGDSIVSYFS